VEWILLAHGVVQWQAVVKTAKKTHTTFNYMKFLDLLNDYQLLKSNSAAWTSFR
jgi:hypothetical protein